MYSWRGTNDEWHKVKCGPEGLEEPDVPDEPGMPDDGGDGGRPQMIHEYANDMEIYVDAAECGWMPG